MGYLSVPVLGTTDQSVFTDTWITATIFGKATEAHFLHAANVRQSTVGSFAEMLCMTLTDTKVLGNEGRSARLKIIAVCSG